MDLDDDELKATKNIYNKKGEGIMYKMKPEYSSMIKKKRLNRKLSQIVGVTEGYMSGIVNNSERRNISKTVAYATAKAIDSNLEILDVFDIFVTKE